MSVVIYLASKYLFYDYIVLLVIMLSILLLLSWEGFQCLLVFLEHLMKDLNVCFMIILSY